MQADRRAGLPCLCILAGPARWVKQQSDLAVPAQPCQKSRGAGHKLPFFPQKCPVFVCWPLQASELGLVFEQEAASTNIHR